MKQYISGSREAQKLFGLSGMRDFKEFFALVDQDNSGTVTKYELVFIIQLMLTFMLSTRERKVRGVDKFYSGSMKRLTDDNMNEKG